MPASPGCRTSNWFEVARDHCGRSCSPQRACHESGRRGRHIDTSRSLTIRAEPRPEARADLGAKLEHPVRNQPLQKEPGLALLVLELGISLAGEPSVEEADPDRAEALDRPRQPVGW